LDGIEDDTGWLAYDGIMRLCGSVIACGFLGNERVALRE
jgi:hypothetical protein